ncbi:MAG: helix-turn-helix transcriptional regulator [bacterium]|nr:helix-turn-helix transcriptional regulator [bacterium]
MTLGEKIRKLREEKKLSQDKLGEAIGIYGRHLSKIENNKVSPSLDVLRNLATTLGISSDYLIFDDVPLKRPSEKVFDAELFDLFYALEELPKEKIDHLKVFVNDLILANKASHFVQTSKRPYSKRK